MNLTKTDATILFVYAAFAVIGGFMFPALGMGLEEQQASDVPQLNITSNEFDFVRELPEFPVRASKGTLNHSSDKFDNSVGSIQHELGPGDDGNRTFLVAINETAVHLTDVEAGADSDLLDWHNFTAEGNEATLTGNGYEVDVHSENLTHGEFEWIATDRPQDSNLPILGGIADFTDKLVSVVAWFVSTIAVFITNQVVRVANLAVMMLDVVTYFIDLAAWFTTNTFNFINGAPGYAQVILTVGGLPAYYVFGKVVIILINMVNPFG